MKKVVIFFIAMLTCFSCKRDILDLQPISQVGDDAVWVSESLIRAYQTEIYNVLPTQYDRHMWSKYTDEAYNAQPVDDFKSGTVSPDNIAAYGVPEQNFLYIWGRGYQYIRKINVFLEKMATTTVPMADKATLIAETKFLRAYIYFMLIQRFGGVPIVDKVYYLGATENFKRNTLDECAAYLDKDLTEAIPNLPAKLAANAGTFGRVTQDACLALRSRVYLMLASPLFNPTNDVTKWQKAADAAAVLLTKGYSLYPDYRLAFNRPSGTANSELIFAMNFTSQKGHQVAALNLGRRYGAYGGWNASNGPSTNLVDDYDMTNGEPAFITVGGVKTINPLGGYDPQHPYDNRDPRMDATIVHDGTVYHGDLWEMWVASDGKTWGFDSYKQSSDNPVTNTMLKKFMPDADIPVNFATRLTNPWQIFRLGEIYLNYAEAKFELGDENTTRQYLSLIRARVGMPAIPATVTGEALRARLYNERRIELAFEGFRFWDLRRWKLAATVESKPIYGTTVIKDVATGVKTYTVTKLLDRTWTDKMYFLPIERAELNRNPGLTQTTGWPQ